MKKSFAVIGLGRFGLGVVKTLSNQKCDIIAVDVDKNSVALAANYIETCVIADATNIQTLKDLGIGHVDHAIVAIGNNFQATIMATINLKELGVKKVTVRVDAVDYIDVMKRLGASEVIVPEEASAVSLANQIISDNILDYYKVKDEYGVVQIKIKANFENKTLAEMDPRNTFDVSIVGIIRDKKFILPKGTDTVCGDDIILVIGKNDKVYKFEEYLNK